MNHIKSEFQFDDYMIKKTIFEINDDFNGGEVELDLNMFSDFKIYPEKNAALVLLGCEIFKNPEQNNFPFNLVVEIVGKFNLIGEHNNEEVVSLCRLNATAILFPYLRGYISNLTSLSGISTIILPTINVERFLEGEEA